MTRAVIAVGVFIRVETAADLAPRPGQQRCWRPACFPVWSPWQPLAVQDALPGSFIMSLDENFIKSPDVSYRETICDFLETSRTSCGKVSLGRTYATGEVDVAASASPTVRRRRLAAELRRLRGTRTGGAVAKALGWSPAKVSRYELGQSSFPLEEIEKLLDFYGVTEPRRGQLLALAEDANQRGWWEEYADALTPDYMEFLGLEAEADRCLRMACWRDNTRPFADRGICSANCIWTIRARSRRRRVSSSDWMRVRLQPTGAPHLSRTTACILASCSMRR